MGLTILGRIEEISQHNRPKYSDTLLAEGVAA